jgi:hypothetical protein
VENMADWKGTIAHVTIIMVVPVIKTAQCLQIIILIAVV